MKKILILGAYDSTYIQHYINDVLLPLGFDVYILIPSPDIKNPLPESDYLHKVEVFPIDSKIILLKKILRRLTIFRKIIKLRKYGPYDFIHIQYVDVLYLRIASLLKRKKLVVSYWGSDILRNSKRNLKIIKKFYDRNMVDYVSGDSTITRDAFIQFYGLKNKYNLVYYGDSICDQIDGLDITKDDIRAYFDIPKEKIVVSVGYNARKSQQHLEVLRAFAESRVFDKDKYYFVFQMTYCLDDMGNYKEILQFLEREKFQYKLIENYLSEKEVAMLRASVDVFINSQTTDAFCNTIKEYFYCKKIILNPKWLHYGELDNLKLSYIEYETFSQLPELLNKISMLITEEDLTNNYERLKDKLNWDSCKNEWEKIYMSLLE